MNTKLVECPRRGVDEPKHSRWFAFAPACVCLALNLTVFAAVSNGFADYLSDFRLNSNPDARHYVVLGRNTILRGEYSRCEEPPYHPDILRTPVYPIFAGGLDLLGGAGAIYVTQAILHAISCWLLFGLLQPYFGHRIAFCAGLMLGSDLMLTIANFEAMSEALFIFLVLASARFIIPVVAPAAGCEPSKLQLSIGGFLLGLATLTRPAGLYLCGAYAVLIAVHGLGNRRFLRPLVHVALLLTATGTPVAAWVLRNYQAFSVPQLTNADAIMLVYFCGAGAYQVERGCDLEEAQQAIAEEFHLPPPRVTNNHWIVDRSVKELDGTVRGAVVPVLLKYPSSLVASSLLGIAKSSLSHNVSLLAYLTGHHWNAPGTTSLLRFESGGWKRLAHNDILLVSAFVWQMFHMTLTYLLAIVGIVLTLRVRQYRWIGMSLLLIVLYFLLTVGLVGLDAYWRSRGPHMPFLYAFAGFSIGRLVWRQTGSSAIQVS